MLRVSKIGAHLYPGRFDEESPTTQIKKFNTDQVLILVSFSRNIKFQSSFSQSFSKKMKAIIKIKICHYHGFVRIGFSREFFIDFIYGKPTNQHNNYRPEDRNHSIITAMTVKLVGFLFLQNQIMNV